MKIKINKFKLLEQMENNNIARNGLAALMGINKQILYRKIENGFSFSEIYHICGILSVDESKLV